MSRKKLTVLDLQEMKERGDRVVWVTAYDFITAQLAEQAGIDMLLVGDSLGMCIYGYDGTIPVTMDQCIYHCEAVRRAARNTFVIGDMPFGSYQISTEAAIANAVRFHKEAHVDAVKLEGGARVADVVRGIANSGMLVMGHIGLTPQSSNALGGFKAQGRTAETAMAVIEDARIVYEAGAFSILIEAVPPEVTQIIRDDLPIPVYSIGAGIHADGQLMIVSDLVGHFQAFTPKFVKRYGNVAGEITKSFESYIKDVKKGAFPGDEHTYRMIDGELPRLIHELKK
ncbi:MAG: 3-methyl-2-oxobutanoate hydroxymethyltransferase [Desulfobacterales bacterium]|nr:3-methyl-2-oxobutanoate hydroxymethyltransferase [Desulfobacterales bacterium]MBL7101711.1 3-methyl-2-oxobutanoate hydroxymethyltransferase [Desulfobacteraceae bacterium]MBL7172907.1 3-methyl-2-oxobutanoate hydroxymethyltransferase [Desulfobacteraceae bacterium]MBU0990722.1 3-methyl-2-oxobutanoate hydroxymethyltransferase [Pseudomonadota bacterium]